MRPERLGNGRRADPVTRMRLSRFIAPHGARRLNLDVEFERGHRVIGFRVVVLPGRKAMMRPCTNLSRTPFSLDPGRVGERVRQTCDLVERRSYVKLVVTALAAPARIAVVRRNSQKGRNYKLDIGMPAATPSTIRSTDEIGRRARTIASYTADSVRRRTATRTTAMR